VVHFRPEDLGWPTAYFEDHDEGGEDIGLHEIEAIAETGKPVTAILP
jgi:3-hydroxyacyl-CoA dehydrogenase